MKSLIKKTFLVIFTILLIFSPSEILKETDCIPHSTPFPIQKEYGSMDFLKNGAHIKTEYVIRPSDIRGLYITGWTAGSSGFDKFIKIAKETEINTFVIDVKDATGYISYQSNVPLSKQIHSSKDKIRKIQKFVSQCRENGIYPVARIVVFKDPVLARHRKDLVIKKANGAVYYDRSGLPWVDPYSKTVWKYNVDIAIEAISMGFEEVQFDYVRFPAISSSIKLVYPHNKNHISKEDDIQAFLRYATGRIHKYGVKVEVDVFGLVLSAENDLGIGQRLEKIATYADCICPMVYPSHYRKGSYGIADPDAHPYETISKCIKDGKERLAAVNSNCILIPYLQDFTLYHHYGVKEIQQEKKALYDNKIKQWFMWNAANVYTVEALKTQH